MTEPKPSKVMLYIWYVENIHLWWKKTGEKIISPSFEVDWLPGCSFSLWLYPKGVEGYEDYISLFLSLENEASIAAFKDFKADLYLSSVDRIIVRPESYDGFMTNKNDGFVGCPRFISWNNLMKNKSIYFPDEIVTLCCVIRKNAKSDGKGKAPEDDFFTGFARTRIKKEIIAKQMVIDCAIKEQEIGTIKSVPRNDFTAIFSTSICSFSRSINLTIDVRKNDNIKLAIVKLMLIDEKRKKIYWMNTSMWNDTNNLKEILVSPNFKFDSPWYVPLEIFAERFLFLACEFTFTAEFIDQKQENHNYGNSLNNIFNEPSNVKAPACQTLSFALQEMYWKESSHDVTIKTNKPDKEVTAHKKDASKDSSRDVTTKTNKSDKEITAHKIVLHSRSEKFATILSVIPGNKIKLDEDFETMKAVVNFLYTDTTPNLNWQKATTLYKAGKEYGVDLLQHKCGSFLVANLNESNVGEILLLARELHDYDMIASIKNFIMENSSAIYGSKHWDNFRKNHPNYAAEIMLNDSEDLSLTERKFTYVIKKQLLGREFL